MTDSKDTPTTAAPPLPEAQDAAPTVNQGMLDALSEIAERQKDRPYTSAEDTDRLIREARSGAMYGLDPTPDE